ncbi:hypothetical protein DRP77_06000 [Candidatus Poribacteria bacterium]|nr:MAG: hypothetical protein DRP77_06000 [Candidatus Poribacteria bacterium]
MRFRKFRKGFTLLEILLVVVILGILVAIAIPRFTGGAKEAKINACKANIALINTVWELDYIKNGEWRDLDDLLNDKNYFPDGPPKCPFGDPYEDKDGDHRVDPHNHE